jgi:serine/threonine-protein kinase
MLLNPGSKLAGYEILAAIGAGGMGEVYKARDTKLSREVAIKVLPEAFSKDKERLARFEREARLLASLNHPNIAAIYDLEESDGMHFLVLELVLGDTLAERIQRGAISVEEALPLFNQIAEGLEAAHETGIIHRDLKPANVKVTPEGKIKILDFGLAKAFGEEQAVSDLSQSPTMARDETRAGVILGTAAYMSPEQARGKEVDKRTDIWSLGCVLYEALTGQKAFQGETVTDVLASVVKTEPDWSGLPKNLPWKIRELLERCLRKDPGMRLRDIGDARLEIDDTLSGHEAFVGETVTAKGHPRFDLLTFIAGVAAASILTSIVVWSLMRSDPLPLRRFAIHIPPSDELVQTYGTIAISPDGRNLVYAASRSGGVDQLYLHPLDQLEPTPIRGTEGSQLPFFSPDGQWIGFWAAGEFKKVSIAGGVPLFLCDVLSPRGASWGTAGFIFFSSLVEAKLQRIPATGGTPEAVGTASPEKDEQGQFWPDVLPGGKAVLYTSWSGSLDNASIVVQSLDTGERRTIIEGGTRPRFVPSGHIIFARDSSLLAAPFDKERLELTGSAVQVLDDVFLLPNGDAKYEVSKEGSLFYIAPSGRERRLVWVDRQGVEKPLTETVRLFQPHPSLSPDGRRLAVSISEANADIWVLELSRGTLSRLTFGRQNYRPIWSPDGRELFFGSSRVGGTYGIFSKPSDGSGPAMQIASGAYRMPTSLSSDGRTIVFRQNSETTGFDIGMVHFEDEQEPEILLGTPFDEHSGMLSPDDRWLAYVSNESGQDEVYVTRFPSPEGRLQVSIEGGTEPMWSHDGKELFYRNGEKMMAVAISTDPELTPGKPIVLFEGRYRTGILGAGTGSNYDVARDGQFVMIQQVEGAASNQINVVLNWFEELERLVPTN